MLVDLFREAVMEFGGETEFLRWLPENRYNRRVFPTVGQYDWFDGQLLYCLVRKRKPRHVLEISMSSGYTTAFTASALRANGSGTLHTFELDRRCVAVARRNFRKWGLDRHIDIHAGDARETCRSLPGELPFDILFLDSLHTEGFIRWFIETFVLKAPLDSLFHVHDVLPEGTPRHSVPSRYPGTAIHTLRWNLMDPLRLLRRREEVQEDWTEEKIVHRLSSQMSTDEYAYLHDVADRFPELSPRVYDHMAVGRVDSSGAPREYNQSFWCRTGAVQRIYPSIRG